MSVSEQPTYKRPPNPVELLGRVLEIATIDAQTACAILTLHNGMRRYYRLSYKALQRNVEFWTAYRALVLTAAHEMGTLGELEF